MKPPCIIRAVLLVAVLALGPSAARGQSITDVRANVFPVSWVGAIGDAELASLATTTRVKNTDVTILAMTGSDAQVMLGGIMSPGDGQTWFVKSTVAKPSGSASMKSTAPAAAAARRTSSSVASGTP